MKYRSLGRTGLQVSALSFGALTFSDGMGAGSVGRTSSKDAERIVGLCLDAGVNLFDTADAYSDGRSEEILGEAICNRRKEALIATKVFGRMAPGANNMGASRHHIIDACDASLRRLKTDYIDLYQLHGFDSLTPLEETLRALDDLVRAGKVRYIGASNYAGWQLMKALGISDARNLERYASQQIYYSLIGRDGEAELLPLARDQGVGVLVFSPLAFGLLSGKFRRGRPDPEGARATAFGAPIKIDRETVDKVTDLLAELASNRGVSAAQCAINWLLSKPAVSSVIVGASNETQLNDNLAAVHWSLTPEEVALLDEASAVPLPYPHPITQQWFAERNPA
ncbi:aldo/keto reductase [Sphingopyxis sp.]|uniref:aldo/keto reductase n=1 Tax=Sphingopyxis sp. TaxID=1908224 RepID=UPI002D78F370|nr:aldo/keto reductase [Sphingopyxis sp.]HET6522887.1 aldo/keto reductase [Sphingopyxis sp.]